MTCAQPGSERRREIGLPSMPRQAARNISSSWLELPSPPVPLHPSDPPHLITHCLGHAGTLAAGRCMIAPRNGFMKIPNESSSFKILTMQPTPGCRFMFFPCQQHHFSLLIALVLFEHDSEALANPVVMACFHSLSKMCSNNDSNSICTWPPQLCILHAAFETLKVLGVGTPPPEPTQSPKYKLTSITKQYMKNTWGNRQRHVVHQTIPSHPRFETFTLDDTILAHRQKFAPALKHKNGTRLPCKTLSLVKNGFATFFLDLLRTKHRLTPDHNMLRNAIT